MKAVMMLFDSELVEEALLMIKISSIQNYTHFTGLHGSSKAGKKEGSAAWPGTNEIIMILLGDDELKKLKKVIGDFKLKHPESPLLFFNWPLNEVSI